MIDWLYKFFTCKISFTELKEDFKGEFEFYFETDLS